MKAKMATASGGYPQTPCSLRLYTLVSPLTSTTYSVTEQNWNGFFQLNNSALQCRRVGCTLLKKGSK